MIDHLVGRPSPGWKRTQVYLVVLFWIIQLVKGGRQGPRFLWIRKANRLLTRFTPWQVLVTTLTALYGVRNLNVLTGFDGLDAGFATAMSIKHKWLRDIASIVFSIYYLLYADAADELLRKHRALCTPEMLRTTWEKTSNPFLRMISHFRLPSMGVQRKILIPRPKGSKYKEHMIGWLYFSGTPEQLSRTTELIFDCPGGGFIAMTPEHHEERLRLWTVHSGKPVLALQYRKAPEYPYPWAINEAFDAYQTVVATEGRILGMSGDSLEVIVTGDSAGGNLAMCIMLKILESSTYIQRPLALVLSYPALDFNYTSWMTPRNLAVVSSETSCTPIPGFEEQKRHFSHKSPLSVVDDVQSKVTRRKRSWIGSLSEPFVKPKSPKSSRTSLGGSSHRFVYGSGSEMVNTGSSKGPLPSPRLPTKSKKGNKQVAFMPSGYERDGEKTDDDHDASESEYLSWEEDEKPILARVLTSETMLARPAVAEKKSPVEVPVIDVVPATPVSHEDPTAVDPSKPRQKVQLGTQLTMTSRTGFFQDRIISPSMMRTMAILYIGPNRAPDFEHDYYLSPILAPDELLAQFPTVLLNCGERDPLVDDTIILAGRIRNAKYTRKAQVAKEAGARAAERGESLHVCGSSSSGAGGMDAAGHEANHGPLPPINDPMRILAETDQDWVQLRIVEGWSHGYLQMHSLIPEVGLALQHLAEWMEDIFARQRLERDGVAHASAMKGNADEEIEGRRSMTTPKARKQSAEKAAQRRQDTGTSETETEGPLTFTPKKRRTPPTSFSNVPENGSQGDRATSQVGSSSSGETLIGPFTPDSIEAISKGGNATISVSARRPREGTERHAGPGDGNRKSPHPAAAAETTPKGPDGGKVAAGVAKGLLPTRTLGVTTSGTRTGTPVFAQGSQPLSEAELMKRRREEAVVGLMAEQVVEGPGGK
ncbi:hypothetical protein FRC04_004250 [Tulasnella sp. 424]|nr:hypothetical protein FRC04_004250 [Tulasnella sp. 424]KAG8979375.1 hypothetical protein FRC05_008360 [Tulasnella sp. 425]